MAAQKIIDRFSVVTNYKDVVLPKYLSYLDIHIPPEIQDCILSFLEIPTKNDKMYIVTINRTVHEFETEFCGTCYVGNNLEHARRSAFMSEWWKNFQFTYKVAWRHVYDEDWKQTIRNICDFQELVEELHEDTYFRTIFSPTKTLLTPKAPQFTTRIETYIPSNNGPGLFNTTRRL